MQLGMAQIWREIEGGRRDAPRLQHLRERSSIERIKPRMEKYNFFFFFLGLPRSPSGGTYLLGEQALDVEVQPRVHSRELH